MSSATILISLPSSSSPPFQPLPFAFSQDKRSSARIQSCTSSPPSIGGKIRQATVL